MAGSRKSKNKSDENLTLGGRIPPQAVDVERYVLGALLLDKEACAIALETIDETDLYRDSHRQIFRAMLGLYQKNEPIDLITLTEELQRNDSLEAVGGAAYLAELASLVPSSANIEYHLQIVKEKAVLRKLIRACTDILSEAYDSQAEVESVLSKAQQDIFDLLKNQRDRSYREIGDVLNATFTELERLHHLGHTGIIGVPSGFAKLDAMTSGFQKSDLIILAGRPSMGKTAFGLNIARNAAVEHDIGVGIFSLEMSDMQLVQRLLCCESMVDSQRLRTGHLRENEWPKLSRCAGRLAEAPIYIDDTAGLDIIKLSARARRMALERKIGLLIVDYMQLMDAPKGFDNRQQEISYISRSLKMLAKQLNIPIIALSQLSRAVESRPDKRPMLSDLRECITGDTRIYLPDPGIYVPVKSLMGQSDFNVLALTPEQKLERAPCREVWESGVKEIFEVETQSGATIKTSIDHPFFTMHGWAKLGELEVGDLVATACPLDHFSSHPSVVRRWLCNDIKLVNAQQGVPQQTFYDAPGTPAELLDREKFTESGQSPINWEQITRIEHIGKEMTYDLHVANYHNYVANDFIIHNSGAIEQDADLVMFVYREEFYLKDQEDPKFKEVENLAEIIVGKHRNGPVGTVKLTFLKQYGKFSDTAPEPEEGIFQQKPPF